MIIKKCLDKMVAFFEGETRTMTMPHEEAHRDDEDNMVSRLFDKTVVSLLSTGRIIGCI